MKEKENDEPTTQMREKGEEEGIQYLLHIIKRIHSFSLSVSLVSVIIINAHTTFGTYLHTNTLFVGCFFFASHNSCGLVVIT